MQLRVSIELGPGNTALNAGRSDFGVDINALHWRQVDHHSAVDGCPASHVWTAPAYRHLEAELLGEIDSINQVRNAPAPGDQCWPLVDKAIVDLSCVVVPGIGRLQKLPPEGCDKLSGSVSNGRYRHGVLILGFEHIMSSIAVSGRANAKNSAVDELFSSKVAPMEKLPPLIELRAFDAAARHLSFKKAATELGVTPTAISHQIRLLERYCGCPLFRRRPRPLSLTDAGARLFPAIRAGLEAFAAA